MTESHFFENIIASDREKESASVFLKSKGIVKHNIIKQHLMLRSSVPNIEYSLVASTYRYDKRLRLVLFRFISYLEEYYRGILLDAYFENINQTFWLKSVSHYIKIFNNDLDRALEKIQFRELVSQLKRAPALRPIICFTDGNKKRLNANLSALCELRNAVMHNKLLVLSKDYGECCSVKGIRSSTLTSNIKNLLNFLPTGPRKKCIDEINKCSVNKNQSGDVSWNLPSYIIVKV